MQQKISNKNMQVLLNQPRIYTVLWYIPATSTFLDMAEATALPKSSDFQIQLMHSYPTMWNLC